MDQKLEGLGSRQAGKHRLAHGGKGKKGQRQKYINLSKLDGMNRFRLFATTGTVTQIDGTLRSLSLD
jgi:hypothetical protein